MQIRLLAVTLNSNVVALVIIHPASAFFEVKLIRKTFGVHVATAHSAPQFHKDR